MEIDQTTLPRSTDAFPSPSAPLTVNGAGAASALIERVAGGIAGVAAFPAVTVTVPLSANGPKLECARTVPLPAAVGLNAPVAGSIALIGPEEIDQTTEPRV